MEGGLESEEHRATRHPHADPYLWKWSMAALGWTLVTQNSKASKNFNSFNAEQA